MLEAKSKMYNWKRGGKMVYIPNKIASDSAFPLTSTVVAVKIDGKKIVIENE